MPFASAWVRLEMVERPRANRSITEMYTVLVTTRDGSAEEPLGRSDQARASAALVVSLPNGGGAIPGIGELAANPVTRICSVSVPLAVSPGSADPAATS